jgi:hypothetical protein
VRRVSHIHHNEYTRNSLQSLVEKTLDEEGLLYILTRVDRDPTEDAYGFIIDTPLRRGIRITVEDE